MNIHSKIESIYLRVMPEMMENPTVWEIIKNRIPEQKDNYLHDRFMSSCRQAYHYLQQVDEEWMDKAKTLGIEPPLAQAASEAAMEILKINRINQSKNAALIIIDPEIAFPLTHERQDAQISLLIQEEMGFNAHYIYNNGEITYNGNPYHESKWLDKEREVFLNVFSYSLRNKIYDMHHSHIKEATMPLTKIEVKYYLEGKEILETIERDCKTKEQVDKAAIEYAKSKGSKHFPYCKIVDKVYLFTPPQGQKYYAEEVSRVGEGYILDGKFTGKIKLATAKDEHIYPLTIDISNDVWHKTHNHPTYNTVMVNSIEVANVQEAQFKIGDEVTFTNDNGVVFKDKTVVGIERGFEPNSEPRYYIEPTDAPWYSKRARNLQLKTSDNQRNIMSQSPENNRTPDTIQKLKDTITAIVRERFPESYLAFKESTLGGEHRPSLAVYFAIGKDKTEWANGIIENDRGHTIFLVHTNRDKEGAISNLTLKGRNYGYYTPGKPTDRLSWRNINNPTNIAGIEKNLTKYFTNMKEAVQGLDKNKSMER